MAIFMAESWFWKFLELGQPLTIKMKNFCKFSGPSFLPHWKPLRSKKNMQKTKCCSYRLPWRYCPKKLTDENSRFSGKNYWYLVIKFTYPSTVDPWVAFSYLHKAHSTFLFSLYPCYKLLWLENFILKCLKCLALRQWLPHLSFCILPVSV